MSDLSQVQNESPADPPTDNNPATSSSTSFSSSSSSSSSSSIEIPKTSNERSENYLSSAERKFEEDVRKVIEEGTAIFKDYQRRMKTDNDFATLEFQGKYEFLKKVYLDYTRQNPLIVRFISLGLYHPKAVERFMKKCQTCPPRNDEQYCERQADYVKYIYMNKREKYSTEFLNSMWRSTKEGLMAEIKANKERHAEIKKRRAENKDNNNIKKRADLIRALQHRYGQIAAGENNAGKSAANDK